MRPVIVWLFGQTQTAISHASKGRYAPGTPRRTQAGSDDQLEFTMMKETQAPCEHEHADVQNPILMGRKRSADEIFFTVKEVV